MKDNLFRIIFCFAALDLSEEELRSLVNDLHTMQWEEINVRVSLMRQCVLHHRVNEDTRPPTKKRSKIRSRDTSVGERVEQLLKLEAQLTTAQAVEKLASQLTEMGMLEQQDIPPLSRKTLRSWIERLLK